MPIPKIIHQLAPADKSKWHPVWTICSESWKNVYPSNFQHIIWSDENADDYHQIPYVGLALKGKDGKEIQVTAMSKKKIGVPGDFFFYYPYGDGKRITRYPGWEVQLTSAKHFDKLGTLKHDGYDFPIPGDPEAYLEYLYGKDWKTPKSNSGLNDDCEFIARAKGKAYCYSHREGKYKK